MLDFFSSKLPVLQTFPITVPRTRRLKRRKSRRELAGAPLTMSTTNITCVDPRDLIPRILADPVRSRHLLYRYEATDRVSEFNQTPYVMNFFRTTELISCTINCGVITLGDMVKISKLQYMCVESLSYQLGDWKYCQERLIERKEDKRNDPSETVTLSDEELNKQWPILHATGTILSIPRRHDSKLRSSKCRETVPVSQVILIDGWIFYSSCYHNFRFLSSCRFAMRPLWKETFILSTAFPRYV
jgi:hypothetical protein